MPQAQTVQNNFKEGLKTEFTGLNFPENAATDTSNCVYTLVGDVQRRGGIDYESNFLLNRIDSASVARSSYRWLNAGGDGQSQILVYQIGNTIYFFLSSAVTTSLPLSKTMIPFTINLDAFAISGTSAQTECQYTSGNGFLFIFNPKCDPIYCIFIPGLSTITANRINIQIRDVVGIPELGIADNARFGTLTQEHLYNLTNQGWTQGSGWNATGTGNGFGSPPCVGGQVTFNISSQANTTTIIPGSSVQINFTELAQVGSNNGNNNFSGSMTGTVNSYSATTPGTITLTASSVTYNCQNTALGFWSGGNFFATPNQPVTMTLLNQGFISKWFQSFANYPSNADIWWLYKDSSNAFNPGATFPNIPQPSNVPASKGFYILSAFNQQRSSISGITGLTDVITSSRPTTGAWYAGRVFYAGVNGSQQALGDEPYYTWTENIYFSQIIQRQDQFGKCYQDNDPTSQNLFSILPSDGGVITIPGMGAVYKLFPLRFGLLVFAANGIWFIGGSSGIGFTADDFTVTKISSIQSISGSSFVDVQGYPMFWNQEGIYEVTPTQQAGSAHSPDIQLDVRNLCLGTILTFYDGVPLASKPFARGDYDYLSYIVQWCFRSTAESGISNRYSFDTIISYNTVTKAFYPYSLPTNSLTKVTDIKYIQNPGGPNNVNPIFKYFLSNSGGISFGEEKDFTNFVDFISENSIGYNYTSFFVTGYTLPGQALRKIQIPIVYLFSRNPLNSECFIQAIWDYAGSTASGKESTRQIVTMVPNSLYRKIRLRGRGMAVQLKIQSIQGKPFDLMGWAVLDQINQVV